MNANFVPVMQAEKPPLYLLMGLKTIPYDKNSRTMRISEFTFDKFKVMSSYSSRNVSKKNQ
jgi:hypothetical protein